MTIFLPREYVKYIFFPIKFVATNDHLMIFSTPLRPYSDDLYLRQFLVISSHFLHCVYLSSYYCVFIFNVVLCIGLPYTSLLFNSLVVKRWSVVTFFAIILVKVYADGERSIWAVLTTLCLFQLSGIFFY